MSDLRKADRAFDRACRRVVLHAGLLVDEWRRCGAPPDDGRVKKLADAVDAKDAACRVLTEAARAAR